MGRTKIIPDAEVFVIIRKLLAAGGEKAVAFASVARATGLSGATLVQRFGSRAGMIAAARHAAWDAADRALDEAAQVLPPSQKNAHGFLRLLTKNPDGIVDAALLAADFRDAALTTRAENWRAHVEGVLAGHFGGGAAGREAAAVLFASWQGQLLWRSAGGKGFRIKDAARRLT